jgi:pseudaminic acid cytidylyltransferase
MSAVAIIPARGGSKRIPRKNIRNFNKKPIIAYPIEAALASGCFDEVMVSTDDSEIAEVARFLGAKTPFMRSAKTADDYSTLADVLQEVLVQYQNAGKPFEYFCCLLPTSPFVTPETIKSGFELLKNSQLDSVLTVAKYAYPIQRALKFNNDDTLAMFWPENYTTRSQDLEPAYHDAGQLYWMRSQALLDQMRLFADKSGAVVLSPDQVQDIDSQEDWASAELKFQLMQHLKT